MTLVRVTTDSNSGRYTGSVASVSVLSTDRGLPWKIEIFLVFVSKCYYLWPTPKLPIEKICRPPYTITGLDHSGSKGSIFASSMHPVLHSKPNCKIDVDIPQTGSIDRKCIVAKKKTGLYTFKGGLFNDLWK